MNSKLLMGSALLLAALSAGAATLAVQDKPKAGPGDDPMMAKWMEYATPGEAHKVLEPNVGKWTLKVKQYMKPGEPAVESDATSEVEWIMENRFTQEKVKGTFMGKPFTGMGVCGYDNLKKKYVSTWVDNMATGIMTSEGTYDVGTKTLSSTGECPDPMTGKYVKGHSTMKWTDKDHWVMQSYHPGPDGKDALMMEISATRAK